MAKSDADSHATGSLNGEEAPRLIDPIDLEIADYKTLLSVPQIGAKRALGIMTMRNYSRLSIFNVSETTGLKEDVISRLISCGRITDLPKHLEGMESLEAQPDTRDLEEIRNNLIKMTDRMAAMDGCVTELRLANTNLTQKLEEANNPGHVEQAITRAVEGCMPAIANCNQATQINEQFQENLQACRCNNKASLEEGAPRTRGDELSSTDSGARQGMEYESPSFGTSAAATTVRTLNDLEEEKDDRHDNNLPGWMKDLMGKVPTDNTVQITFIFIGQTHLVFGKRVCTCVTKHSNAFRTFLNWLKNSKRVWHEPKLHILRLPIFANFDL